MKHLLTSIIMGGCLLSASAASKPATSHSDFSRHFNDSTLRVDYVFGGGPDGVLLLLDGQSKTEGWAGRRTHLDEVPYFGNGQIEMKDAASGQTLYRHSFSSLFHEWIVLEEADSLSRAFENTFIMPLPKEKADITITLFDNRMQPLAALTHSYDPADELVARPRHTPNRYEYIHRGGDSEKAIDFAILAEGYRPEEMDSFLEHARETVNTFFSYEPFASHRDDFNFVAVMSPSQDSGVSIPLKGEWLDTAFGSHFSTFHWDRYLTIPRIKAMHDALTGIPYEHLVVLTNTENYGGGGIYNSYTVSAARNAQAKPVVVHEIGHSFGGLADEYFYSDQVIETYPLDIEPWEPNITTLVDFPSKWKSLIAPGTPIPTPGDSANLSREETKKLNARLAEEYAKTGKINETVGLYEGGGYRAKGIYRPVDHCRMRDNVFPKFCPACEAALARLIEFYTK